MKIIKAYWENIEFCPQDGRQADGTYNKVVRHDVTYKVADDATDEEINEMLRRKDVILIEN